MAQQNRTTLKGYFNTGDFPTEANFGDLIDSNFNLSSDDTDDITEGATNKFLSAESVGALPEAAIPLVDGDQMPVLVVGTPNTLQKRNFVDVVADVQDIFTNNNAFQPIEVTNTVPANGALPNGKQVLVVNSTVGRELYVGDASNNPVPACGYRQFVIRFNQSGTNAPTASILKNTTGLAFSLSSPSRSSAGVYSVNIGVNESDLDNRLVSIGYRGILAANELKVCNVVFDYSAGPPPSDFTALLRVRTYNSSGAADMLGTVTVTYHYYV